MLFREMIVIYCEKRTYFVVKMQSFSFFFFLQQVAHTLTVNL